MTGVTMRLKLPRGLSRHCLSALVIAGVLGGCGSTGAASTTATHTPEASKSAKQILADAAAAIAGAHGFKMQATMVDTGNPSQRLQLSMALSSPHNFSVSETVNGEHLNVVLAGSKAYIRAGRSFWSSAMDNSPRSAVMSDRWIELPTPGSLASVTGILNPSTLASCLVEGHGSLSVAGTTTVNHQPAVLLRDAGNAPGDQPSTLAIAADGVHYPLREVDTGRQRRGGGKSCGGSSGPSTDGTVTLSRFGHVGEIRPPAGAVTIKELFPDLILPTAPNT
jgi:hypothetical protein